MVSIRPAARRRGTSASDGRRRDQAKAQGETTYRAADRTCTYLIFEAPRCSISGQIFQCLFKTHIV